MYYCLTGERPEASNERKFSEKDGLTSPSKAGAEISEQDENILLRGMAIDGKNRYQSMNQLIEAIGKNDEPKPRPPKPVPNPIKSAMIAGGLIGIICLFSLAFLMFGNKAESHLDEKPGDEQTNDTETVISDTEKNADVVESSAEAEEYSVEIDNDTISEEDNSEVRIIGQVENYTYENYYFNVRCVLDESWDYLSQAALNASNGLTRGSTFSDEKSAESYIDERTETSGSFYDMYAMQGEGLPNINMALIRVGYNNNDDVFSEEELLQTIQEKKEELKESYRTGYKEMGATLSDFSSELITVSLFGESHFGIVTKTTAKTVDGSTTIYINQFATYIVEGPYAMQINITYNGSTEQMQAVLDTISRISD